MKRWVFLFIIGCDAGLVPESDDPISFLPRTESYQPEVHPEALDWSSLPNQCESVMVDADSLRLRRIRSVRDDAALGVVAKEMGASERFLRLWASRESSLNPHALHVLDADIQSARASFVTFFPSEERLTSLRDTLEKTEKGTKAWYAVRRKIHLATLYTTNPFRDATVSVPMVGGGRVHGHESISAWSFGYGFFGMNPALFLRFLDTEAPPWIFCFDRGIPAVIAFVWSARAALRKCVANGHGASYVVLNRVLATGHCDREDRDADFVRRASKVGLDPYAVPQLGNAWSSERGFWDTWRHMSQALEASS